MPRQHSARSSATVPPQVSLVESIRRATHQPRRYAWKPYSKEEDAGSSRPRKSAAPIQPTRMPELASPSVQLKSYFEVAETIRECHTNHQRQLYQPQPMYPCARNVASDQEWSMTPQFPMSPATSVDSQPLLDSPASNTIPWISSIPPTDSHILQQDNRVGYVPPYSDLFDFRYSQPKECFEESGVVSSAIGEEMAEKHIYLDESLLNELTVKSYGTVDDFDVLTNALTWEMVGEGKPLAF